jgi:ATP synthase protein I
MYFEVVDRLEAKHYGSPAFSVAGSCTGRVRGLVLMSDDKPPPSLEELDSRLKKIQEKRQRPEGLGMPPTRTGQSLHLGIEMAATLAVGGGVGWFLDRWLDTTPWLLIVFLFLGIGAGLSNAFRLASKYGAELERRERNKGGTPPRQEDE